MSSVEQDASDGDELDHEPASAGNPIDHRADERRHDQERREAERQEQQDPGTGRAEVDVEEERVRERDDHRGVAAHHQGVGDREAAELRRWWAPGVLLRFHRPELTRRSQ